MLLKLSAYLFGVGRLVAASGSGGPAGDGCAPHFSGAPSNSQARANSNGRFASDPDTGLDRAEDRMSTQGNAHEKATGAVKKARSNVRD